MTIAEQVVDIQTVDVDSHEMFPLHTWEATFGPSSGRFAELLQPTMSRFGESANNFNRPGLTDTEEISRESVWTSRGPGAPAAFDLGRREQVLDAMGSQKQLIFPSGALIAQGFLISDELMRNTYGIQAPLDEMMMVLRGTVDEYNDWVIREQRAIGDRCRFAAMLQEDTVPKAIASLEKLLENGVTAVNIGAGAPLGGVSPADHDLDPFWRMAEEANVPILLHVATESGFRASTAWGKAPEFKPGKIESTEFGFEPFSMSVIHQPATTYLTAMVMGGVFERFPKLRLGAIELCGYWLGHLAETLDLWAGKVFAKRTSMVLSMKPSEYLNRNVRVNPFHFEDVASYFERYPHLSDTFCYSSDYPHVEGGSYQKTTFYNKLAPLGDEIVDKFFVKNPTWLLP